MAAASDQDADAEKAADLIEKKQAEPLLATTDDLRAKEKDAYEDKDKLEEDEEATIDEFIHKEGGWGWVIVIATGYCFGTLMGMINNYALIFDKFDKVYNGTENHIFYAAWIGSASTGVQYICCILGSILTDLFGARKVGVLGGLISTLTLFASAFIENIMLYFITYGIGFGLGQALLLSATLSILPHYFKKQLSLANGLMTFIGTVVVVVMPICTFPIINEKKNGLKYTFFFLSAVNFLTILMSLTYKSCLPKNRKKGIMKRLKESLGVKILSNRKFIIWCVGSILGQVTYLTPVIIINHFSGKKFPDHNPLIINVVFAIFSGLGGFFFGKLGDLTKFNRIHYHSLVFLVYSILQFTMPHINSFYVLVFEYAILGVFDGVWLTFLVPISFDVAKSPTLANQAASFHHAAISVPSIIGPAFAGKLFEIYKNYDLSFYICASFGILAVIFQTLSMVDLELIKRIIKKKQIK